MSEVFHGGRLDFAISQYGGRKEDWLDLSTGINPNSYPVPELSHDSWHRLPDMDAEQSMISAAKTYYGASDDVALVPASGTQAIIQTLPLILAQKQISIVAPTYEEHKNCWEKAGREVRLCQDLDEAITTGEIVVVVNPNNPTGQTYQPQELMNAAGKLKEKSGVLIVDEAFADCNPTVSIGSQMHENTIVLRSFGKFFGLAGLRLGFVICYENFANSIRDRLGPWSVSGPALEIGLKAFADKAWIDKTRLEISQHAKAQAEVIEACGLKQIGNAGLFMEFEHPEASRIYSSMQKDYILLRPFAQRKQRLRFGLCKDMQSLERLAFALQKLALSKHV